jgi:ribosomal protein L7/L12
MRPPSIDAVRALVAQARKLEAIKLLREGSDLSLTEAKRRVDELAAPPPD